jgi:hypothetical protein
MSADQGGNVGRRVEVDGMRGSRDEMGFDARQQPLEMSPDAVEIGVAALADDECDRQVGVPWLSWSGLTGLDSDAAVLRRTA